MCGSKERLEFDHIDRETKSFSIASKMTYRKEVILPELKKCRILCRKCHTFVSITQRGFIVSEHGTAGMYQNWSCRCDACRAAWAARRKYYYHKNKGQST